MIPQLNNVGVLLQENVERLEERIENPDYFAEEFRRMEQYDETVCPQRWRNAVCDIKQNGFRGAQVLRDYGKRVFTPPQERLEKIVKRFNDIAKGKYAWDVYREIKIIPMKDIRELMEREEYKKLKNGVEFGDKVKLDDRIEGFSFLFAYDETDSQDNYNPDFDIWGVPKEAWRVLLFRTSGSFGKLSQQEYYNASSFDDVGKFWVLKIGHLSLEELKPISERRFNYIFGHPPAKDKDIVKALVTLNKFPTRFLRDGDRYGIRYHLEEKDLSELEPPKAAVLLYDEARRAQERGLFTDVKVFGLDSRSYKIPITIRDPVIVGFDPFRNRHPLIYWSGDNAPDLK